MDGLSIPPSLAARGWLRLASPHPSGHPRAVPGGHRAPAPGAGTRPARALGLGSNGSPAPNFGLWGNGTSVRRAQEPGPLNPTSANPQCPGNFPLARPVARRKKGTPPPKRRCSTLALGRSQSFAEIAAHFANPWRHPGNGGGNCRAGLELARNRQFDRLNK